VAVARRAAGTGRARRSDLSGPGIPRVLSIAGTDPTGAAGIQADLKSIAAHGGYGMAVVTSLLAQNSRGVRAVHTPPPGFLAEQLRAVSDDVVIDAVKIGMLGTVDIVAVVDSWLADTRPPIVVLDPVMVASSGRTLMDADAAAALPGLLSRVDLVTPNLHELAALLDEPVATEWSVALEQGDRLSRNHGILVLVKGGHLVGAESPDALVDARGHLPGGGHVFVVSGPRLGSGGARGTGCSLSSAVATLRARTGDWTLALATAKAWMSESLEHSGELDAGSPGALSHFHQLWSAGSSS